MNNSYFWSADDAKAGRCSFGSIGIERRYDPPDQLGDLWADDDAAAGRCLASEVGRARRAPFDTFTNPPQSDDEPAGADNPLELDVPSNVMAEAVRLGIPLDDPIKMGFLSMRVIGADEFMRRNASVYNTLIAIQKERDKEAAATTVDIDKLTIRRMRTMQADELSAALLQFVATIPGDDYKAILRRFLGLDDAELQAQLEDAL